MKNLPVEVREKAIEIANALLDEADMDEGIAIATSISRAKDWAANRGMDIEPTSEEATTTDVKEHGEDRYVIPYEGKWAVKSESAERVEKIFDHKIEAVKYGRTAARKSNAQPFVPAKWCTQGGPGKAVRDLEKLCPKAANLGGRAAHALAVIHARSPAMLSTQATGAAARRLARGWAP
jgi:uncharacterized protein YdaT